MLKIGIIGSGAMGSGIAQVAATAGHVVVLCDNNKSALEKAKSSLDSTLKKLVEKQKLTEQKATEISSLISRSRRIKSVSARRVRAVSRLPLPFAKTKTSQT